VSDRWSAPQSFDEIAMLDEKTVLANGQSFFVLTGGEKSAPFALCLHGFPEFSGAWADILPALADRFYVAAPDQRGYGRSSKPEGVENYRAQHLAADMLALAEALAPGRPIHLVAHDWGASVAYMMAFLAPHRIAKLIVLNGVHPVPFQRALLDDPLQTSASQYIHFLRRPDAAALLSEAEFRRLFEFLTGGFGGGRWLTAAKRLAYQTAWQQPGAIEGMVSWYKATPLVVPRTGTPTPDNPIASSSHARMKVSMPHLVLWGEEDKALRPSCLVGLDAFCSDLTVERVPDADHWIIHQQPDLVAKRINAFFCA
jgi:epoxide hydrolase 4